MLNPLKRHDGFSLYNPLLLQILTFEVDSRPLRPPRPEWLGTQLFFLPQINTLLFTLHCSEILSKITFLVAITRCASTFDRHLTGDL